MSRLHGFAGEAIGSFLLVFFGCGSVTATVLFGAHGGLFQVAAIWGIGVTLAIYATRHLSCAHLNPAVSLAMVLGRRMTPAKLPTYLLGQFGGAFLAAGLLYLLFGPSIAAYEQLHGIVRGAPESVKTAMLFGEFYPNPGAGDAAMVSAWNAFGAEATGTFILVFCIFSLTEGCNVGRPDDAIAPLFIGLTVTVIICIVAPLTQAGLNPARDLSPRLFAYLAGWGRAAMPDSGYGFFTVYVLGPLAGGSLAALFFTILIQPLMHKKNQAGCGCR
ncbi:MIP/aquaporin family protein [Thiovibrio sp. JS02]